jgi:hypothetical protein
VPRSELPAGRLQKDLGSRGNYGLPIALFETEMLAEEEKVAGLARLNRALLGRVEAMDSTYRAVLEMESAEIPVYGEPEQGA